MREQCLMLRPHTQTSSPQAGRDAGTPCTTSCRVPPTPRDESFLSPCLYLSFTSMQEAGMGTTSMTARVPPQPRGTASRGTANLPDYPASRRKDAGRTPLAMDVFVHSGVVVGG